MSDLIVWLPVDEVGLEAEPPDAYAAQLVYDENDDADYVLLQYLNAVVYSDGSWKITHYDLGEQDLIIDGNEGTVLLAQERAEKELSAIWEKQGLIYYVAT
jgi:hypothetical protein